jgi:hypothetical protein
MDRRELLRKGGAVGLFGALAGVLASGSSLQAAATALERAPEAKRPKLTKALLVKQKALERDLAALRQEFNRLEQGFGDLSILFREGGRSWRKIDEDNLRGMFDLLEPWLRERRFADIVKETREQRTARLQRQAIVESKAGFRL